MLFFYSSVNADNEFKASASTDCRLLTDEQLEQLQSKKIHFYQFDNGIRAYINRKPELPVFALRLVYDVGASDELKGQSGYAHLFEHMMFKGSKKVRDGEHFAAIKSMGGRLNASTDYDRTDYWTEVPVRFLDQVLWLESERLNHLHITEASLKNQVQAVLQEKLLRIDNVPYAKAASEFMVSAWSNTDYDHLIIGSEEDLKRASVGEVKHFFKQYYRPDNLIMALVGDVEPKHVAKRIEKYFKTRIVKNISDSGGKTSQGHKMGWDSLSGNSENRYDPMAPFPLYALGWHTTGKYDPDIYSVELLADILLNHESSRLKTELKQKQSLVFETIGMPLTFEKAGITVMGMVPHGYADFARIKKVVKRTLSDIEIHGVTDYELCSAKKHRQLLLVNQMSQNRTMATLISDGVLFFDNPWHSVDAIRRYAEVDNQMIIKVANQYFHDDWLALEITAGPGVTLIKWLLETLPENISRSLEKSFL